MNGADAVALRMDGADAIAFCGQLTLQSRVVHLLPLDLLT